MMIIVIIIVIRILDKRVMKIIENFSKILRRDLD